MEKRLLVAFLLSFLFLSIWTKVVAPPPARVPVPKTITNATAPLIAAEPAELRRENPSAQQQPILSERISTLENSKLKVEFSNLGVTIRKVIIKGYQEALPVSQIVAVKGFEQADFQLESISTERIVYLYVQNGEKIRKSYQLLENQYLLNAQLEMSKDKEIEMYTLDISRMDKKAEEDKDNSLYEYSVSKQENIVRKSSAFKFSVKENKVEQVSPIWYGFRNRYFCFVIKPEYESKQYSATVGSEKSISFYSVPRETSVGLSYKLYFGPQKKEIIAKYDADMEKIIAYSDWPILDFPAKWIYGLMVILNKVFHNWGVTIIVLGILIYGLTYPLTMAGLSSMRKMQSLQPKMTQLREQHKNNPQKLNQEMMELYKKHKVNPMGGCLPMLLQMPVFISLYQILWRSVELRGESFLWIKDLSMPDRLFVLSQPLPFMGNEINILPVIMGIVMGFQQKFSMQAMNVSDPAQVQQQKMMMWMLPGMMLIFFYKSASGLTLYFTILYLMTTLTQWKMAKMSKQESND